MFRPTATALSVILLAATVAAKCDSKCMPKNCLQTDETTLATAVANANTALQTLKTTEPQLKQNVANAKAAVTAAQKNVTAMESAETHDEGKVEAYKQMLDNYNAEYKQAEEIVAQVTSDCAGHTTTEPCKTNISNAYANMQQRSANVATANNYFEDAQTTYASAVAAVTAAKATVTNATKALAAAVHAQSDQLNKLQSAVNDASDAEQKASQAYSEDLIACPSVDLAERAAGQEKLLRRALSLRTDLIDSMLKSRQL